MIYTEDSEYRVKFYIDLKTNKKPVQEFLDSTNLKSKTKVLKYIEFLRISKGILAEPYSRHIKDKIWELRVDFARGRCRILYFIFINKNIILLHAFTKHSAKTPLADIASAQTRYLEVINHRYLYE